MQPSVFNHEANGQRPVAFLFPGQGTQFVGMARDLYKHFDTFRDTIDEAGEALEMDIAQMCARGPTEKLNQTENAQPAIFAVSMGIYRVLAQNGIFPCLMAGHSVGEFAALVAGGAMDFATGCALVRARGLIMARAGAQCPGAMAAVVGLSEERVEEVCRQVSRSVKGACDSPDDALMCVACYNSPWQLVISGHRDAVACACAELKRLGAIRVTEVVTSGAFHSPMMQPAQGEMARLLPTIPMRRPDIPVISSVTAAAHSDPQETRGILVRQVTSPVRWNDTMSALLARGVGSFVEVGPGGTLSSLLQHHESGRLAHRTDNLGDLSWLLEHYREEAHALPKI